MPAGSRIKAFLAYLLLAIGAGAVLLFSRNDRFAAYHARQSLVLTLVAVLTPFAWVLVAYPLSWIPLFGPPAASATFGLVIATFIVLFVAWIAGMVFALRAQTREVPLVGALAKRWQN